MGHTVPQMRHIIYDKMAQLKKLSNGLREPEKGVAQVLISYVYQYISGLAYLNPLPCEVEENLIFAMLIEEKKKHGSDLENITLLCFSLIVRNKAAQMDNARDTDRLLPQERQHYLMDS